MIYTHIDRQSDINFWFCVPFDSIILLRTSCFT
nr:MAG TPA: Protein of unknown function (DUF4024) [Caudoviricetes sp.]